MRTCVRTPALTVERVFVTGALPKISRRPRKKLQKCSVGREQERARRDVGYFFLRRKKREK